MWIYPKPHLDRSETLHTTFLQLIKKFKFVGMFQVTIINKQKFKDKATKQLEAKDKDDMHLQYMKSTFTSSRCFLLCYSNSPSLSKWYQV